MNIENCKFQCVCTNWTFLTKYKFDQYLNNEGLDMDEQFELFKQKYVLSILQKRGFWYGWTNRTFVTKEWVRWFLKIASFNVGEQIELF